MEKKRNKMSFYKSIIKKMSKDKTKKSEVHIIDAKNEKITREICTKEILDLLDAPGGKSWWDGAEGKFDEEMAKNSIADLKTFLIQKNGEYSSEQYTRMNTVTRFYSHLYHEHFHDAYHELWDFVSGKKSYPEHILPAGAVWLLEIMVNDYLKAYKGVCSKKTKIKE